MKMQEHIWVPYKLESISQKKLHPVRFIVSVAYKPADAVLLWEKHCIMADKHG